jgi:hypothetical protein
MAQLRDVQVDQNGIAALQASMASVKSDLQRVVDDATTQYSKQVDQLRTGFDGVQAAAGAAQTTPTVETLNAVAASIRALGTDVSTFADDIASTC